MSRPVGSGDGVAMSSTYILVAVGDPVIHPEATHVAAATGHGVVDTVDPREITRRFAAAGFSTRYYTPEVHKAAFALPRYVLDIVEA